MFAAGVHLWGLSAGGDRNLGLCCSEKGLFFGRTPLIERHGGGYAVRPQGDLRRLLGRAFGADADIDRLMPGLAVVKSALDQRNLCLAQIAAVHLRILPLADLLTRAGMEAEDLLIKAERGEILVRAGWDSDAHPRAGVPPNPGWFAPVGEAGGAGSMEIAQSEEEERAPEEMVDPLASARQAQWAAAVATLREIDPANPNLTYVSNLNSAPSQEALDRLNAAVEAATIKRVREKVMPSGMPIGEPGRGEDVRELSGGVEAAEDLFQYLRVGGTDYRSDPNLTIVKLPVLPFIRLHFVRGK